jgi:threonine/homoserine/homoserine lactone efflux protein
VIGDLLAFLAVSIVVIVTPGQDTALTIRNTLVGGRRAGILTAAGVSGGQLCWTVAAAAGLAALLQASEPAFRALKLVGAAYLVYLGVRALLTRVEEDEVEIRAAPLRKLVRDGAVVNILNPKTALFFLAFLPQFVDPEAGYAALQIVFFGLVFVALGLVTDGAYALLAGTAGNWLRSSRAYAAMQRYVSGTVFIGLGLAAALSGSRQRH